jgi:hypothetical protein
MNLPDLITPDEPSWCAGKLAAETDSIRYDRGRCTGLPVHVDLRQHPSTAEGSFQQCEEGMWKIGRVQYEWWCRFTAPSDTLEDLVGRNYSLHVHFYTPESFAELCGIVVKQGLFESLHPDSAPNHRGFAFVLRTA